LEIFNDLKNVRLVMLIMFMMKIVLFMHNSNSRHASSISADATLKSNANSLLVLAARLYMLLYCFCVMQHTTDSLTGMAATMASNWSRFTQWLRRENASRTLAAYLSAS
jgi:hypothetical protein